MAKAAGHDPVGQLADKVKARLKLARDALILGDETTTNAYAAFVLHSLANPDWEARSVSGKAAAAIEPRRTLGLRGRLMAATFPLDGVSADGSMEVRLRCLCRSAGRGLLRHEEDADGGCDHQERAQLVRIEGRIEVNSRVTVYTLALLAAIAAGSIVREARADGKSKAARELAEFLMRKLGKKAVLEGSEALARRIATAASRHGDDVFAAVRRVGPKGADFRRRCRGECSSRHAVSGSAWR